MTRIASAALFFAFALGVSPAGAADTGFPNLNVTNAKIIGPQTPTYNCIAWSLGITNRWEWPGNKVTDFDQLNGRYGYKRMKALDFSPVKGMEKIVLYGKKVDGRWEMTHQARQMPNGKWTSKLGKSNLIEHSTPDDLDGDSYGRPVAVYVRPRR